MMETVILVDSDDQEVGTLSKMQAHRLGLLHRAFSVLLFNSKGEVLLQKRADSKYHSAGLWTNTCCSHPRPNEPIEVAVRRRLREEMGIEAECKFAFKFAYHVTLDNELIENEIDHVFVGIFDGSPTINPEEVGDWKFAPIIALRADVLKNPGQFTHWFKILINHPALATSS